MPSSSVHGISQARILEWVAISFSRGSSQPRDRTWVFCIPGRFLTIWATSEALDFSSCFVFLQSLRPVTLVEVWAGLTFSHYHTLQVGMCCGCLVLQLIWPPPFILCMRPLPSCLCLSREQLPSIVTQSLGVNKTKQNICCAPCLASCFLSLLIE